MKLSDDLSPKWIYCKGILFGVLAMLAAMIILIRVPSVEIALLLAVCVWASCRAYYFAFYVIENYVDGDFRYSGLIDFARYLLGSKKQI